MRSIIQHLRFPFSYLLMPVFLMGVYVNPYWHESLGTVILLFGILHFLVYPSSNAYNSLQDQDTGSIGLIKNPLPATKELAFVSLVTDTLAVALCFYISFQTALFVFIYIAVSRLYSYRKIRLKKYPILGFLVVFIFQGGWIFFTVSMAIGTNFVVFENGYWLYALAASCLIGAIYPLSQIYQHQEDKADGVTTISYLLGKKGTFIFSGILFLVGSIAFLIPFYESQGYLSMIRYLAFQLPSLIYFNYWFYKVIKDESEANYKHTMRMSLISATCMNAFFLFLIFY